jgi:hypothetical protein
MFSHDPLLLAVLRREHHRLLLGAANTRRPEMPAPRTRHRRLRRP